MVLADNAVLSVLPASSNNTLGAPFDVSVQLNPAGNKVCVVSGTLNFNNLTCQNIALASGLMAQVSPTCASPSFTLGIPKCTTAAQNLFSVSVVGANVGQASLSLTGAKIIGIGAIVASGLQNGAYNITAVKAAVAKTTPKPAVETAPTVAVQNSNQQTVQQTASENNNIPADARTAGLATTGSGFMNYLWIILIIIVVLLVIYGIYYMTKKKNKPV